MLVWSNEKDETMYYNLCCLYRNLIKSEVDDRVNILLIWSIRNLSFWFKVSTRLFNITSYLMKIITGKAFSVLSMIFYRSVQRRLIGRCLNWRWRFLKIIKLNFTFESKFMNLQSLMWRVNFLNWSASKLVLRPSYKSKTNTFEFQINRLGQL